jgi:transposase
MEANGPNRKRQRRRTRQERRQIVEETLQPGASVAVVARRHGVNANQVFAWRKLYREGQLEDGETASEALVPVAITESTPAAPRRVRSAHSRKTTGTIDIDLGHARVRIQGRVDPACVRAALEGLVR